MYPVENFYSTGNRLVTLKCQIMNHSHYPSDKMLQLLCKLIRYASIYESNTKLFHRRFREAVDIESLRDYRIFGTLSQTDDNSAASCSCGLKEEEKEMLKLIELGFTAQELSVIYGKSPGSIYVRYHRIRKKLKGRIAIELLFVSLVLLFLTLCVI